MKIIHTADLHLGKILDGYSLIEDQKYILDQMVKVIEAEKPGAFIIAGDIYDKSVPSAEAVALFDSFLTSVAQLKVPVFVISGNHDSSERIAFGSNIMQRGGVYMSPVFTPDSVQPVTLNDEYGAVNFYMLPFIKPCEVRNFYPDASIGADYNLMMKAVVESMGVDYEQRNVLVTHQFITGATLSDSEERPVGGLDNVDVDIIDKFDYVALGHLHKPQSCGGKDYVRYSGSPLKYSLSEVDTEKSMTIVNIGAKGDVKVDTVALTPLRQMRCLKDTYEKLMAMKYYDDTTLPDDYVYVTLTDEQEVPEALRLLRGVYKHLAGLKYDNTTTRTDGVVNVNTDDIDINKPDVLADELYSQLMGKSMTDGQKEYLNSLINKIWEKH